LQVQVRELPESAAELQVQVEVQRVDRAFDDVYRELSQMVRVPGFRPGKTPRWRLRNELGADKVKQAAWDQMAPEVLQRGIELSGLDVIDFEEPGEVRPDEGQPLLLTLAVTRRPKPELAPYQGLHLKRAPVEPTDEDVAERIETLRQAAAKQEDAGREDVQPGDSVYLEMRLFWPGEAEPWEVASEVVVAGQGTLTPPLDRHVLGHKLDETFRVTERYPEDFDSEELAGKEAEFELTISDIKARRVPELDDEFARDAGGVETLEEMREQVRGQLRTERTEAMQGALTRQVLRHLAQTTVVELPPRMVQSAAEGRTEELRALLRTQGDDPDEMLKTLGLEPAALVAVEAAAARSQLTVLLATEAIAEQEGIEASDDEVLAEWEQEARERGFDLPKMSLAEIPAERHDALRGAARRRKVLDRVIELAEVEEVSLEELKAELEPQQEPKPEAATEGAPTTEVEDVSLDESRAELEPQEPKPEAAAEAAPTTEADEET